MKHNSVLIWFVVVGMMGSVLSIDPIFWGSVIQPGGRAWPSVDRNAEETEVDRFAQLGNYFFEVKKASYDKKKEPVEESVTYYIGRADTKQSASEQLSCKFIAHVSKKFDFFGLVQSISDSQQEKIAATVADKILHTVKTIGPRSAHPNDAIITTTLVSAFRAGRAEMITRTDHDKIDAQALLIVASDTKIYLGNLGTFCVLLVRTGAGDTGDRGEQQSMLISSGNRYTLKNIISDRSSVRSGNKKIMKEITITRRSDRDECMVLMSDSVYQILGQDAVAQIVAEMLERTQKSKTLANTLASRIINRATEELKQRFKEAPHIYVRDDMMVSVVLFDQERHEKKLPYKSVMRKPGEKVAEKRDVEPAQRTFFRILPGKTIMLDVEDVEA